jgi:hypothetical protein
LIELKILQQGTFEDLQRESTECETFRNTNAGPMTQEQRHRLLSSDGRSVIVGAMIELP